MKRCLKNFLNALGYYIVQPHLQHAGPDPRTSAATKAAMVGMILDLQARARAGHALPRLSDSGVRVFSQFEEDGYLLYLAAVLELEPKIFVDIGSANGINSNCANLALNLGWHGLFIDGNEGAITHGRKFYAEHLDTSLYPPMFKNAFITAENINQVIGETGFKGKVGIVSIDLDGNDCWVWKALTVVDPAVVIIETHTEFGMENRAVPYDAHYEYPGRHADYHGASPAAMVSLANEKGYRLVGANRYGFNTLYVRRGLHEDRVPEVSLEDIMIHPRYFDRLRLFDPIKEWEYVQI
jgi:hypothetical protein